jgi:hypothetical protein
MAFTWRPYRVIGDANHGEERLSAMKRLRWRSDLIQGTEPS